MCYSNGYTRSNLPPDWSVNCSESLNRTPLSEPCRPRDCGASVNISPCHLIQSFFLVLFYRAWSMRLDLQRNGIKHIVSHQWRRRIEPIKPPTRPAGKLIRSCAYRKEELCFSCPLVNFYFLKKKKKKKKQNNFEFLCAVSIDLLGCLTLRSWGRAGVNKRGHHREIKDLDVTGVVFPSWSFLYRNRHGETHTLQFKSLLWQLWWRLLLVLGIHTIPMWNLIRRNKIICFSFRSTVSPFFSFTSTLYFQSLTFIYWIESHYQLIKSYLLHFYNNTFLWHTEA